MERNRVKRQIREAFRKTGKDLGAYDYNVVVPGSRKMARPYPQLLGKCLSENLKRKVAPRTSAPL